MVESRTPVRLPSGRRLTIAFALGAILVGASISAAPAAAQTIINDAADFQGALASAGNGETVTIGSGVTEIDLSGTIATVTGSGVTLQGAASFDLGQAISTHASQFLTNHSGYGLDRNTLENSLNRLTTDLLANLPSTSIYNSDTSTHGGIEAPSGGFSIKNLTFSGTNAYTDANTGASVYMGLVASSFSRNTTDVNGMKSIENVAFINNVSEAVNGAYSVGVTTFFSQRRYDASGNYLGVDVDETLDLLRGNLFMGNKSITREDDPNTPNAGLRGNGGGLTAWLNIAEMDSNIFVDNYVYGGHAFGGGAHVTSVDSMTKSTFYNNTAEGWHNVQGGGMYVSDAAGFGIISDSIFVGNTATAKAVGTLTGKSASGGGLAVRRGGSGAITNTLFAYNEAVSESQGGSATGGGMSGGNRFESLSDSLFYANVARKTYAVDTVGGAYGGALSFSPGASGHTSFDIVNTSFYANQAISSSGFGGGGAIAIASTATGETADYNVNFKAGSGKSTVFSGNTYNGRANSIYLGALSSSGGTTSRNFVFNIEASSNGLVALMDPLKVDLNNGKTFTLINHAQGGTFIWDGVNDLSAGGGSFINLESGSKTIFEKGFHLHNAGSGNTISVDLDGGADLTMVLTGRNKNMALFEDATITGDAGANLAVVYQGFADYNDSWLLSDAATVQGAALNTEDWEDSATGAKTSVNLTSQGGETWVNLSYSGPTTPFARAGANANQGRYALQNAWENILLPGFSSDEAQTAYYSYILSDLDNYTAEAFATQATIGLSTAYNISNQAITSNQRSWFSAKGPNQPAFGDSEGQVRIWADFIGSRIDQDSRNKYSGYDVTNKGGVIGLSYDSGQTWSFGGYMSISDGETDYDDISAEIDTDIFQGGLFASYKAVTNGFGATMDVSYARMENDSTRRFIGDRYTGSFDQTVFGVGLDLSYEFNPWENGSITPFLNARYQSLDQDSFRESSGTGLLPLHVRSADGDTFTTVLGAKLEHNFQFKDSVLTPRLNLGWRHEFGDRDISTAYDIAGATLVTRADSVETASNSLDVGASFTLVPLKCGNGLDFGINAGYNASISSDRVEHNFYGGVEVKF